MCEASVLVGDDVCEVAVRVVAAHHGENGTVLCYLRSIGRNNDRSFVVADGIADIVAQNLEALERYAALACAGKADVADGLGEVRLLVPYIATIIIVNINFL